MRARGTANDRWLISYADFITLLFATFVLMYVAAKQKPKQPLLPHPTQPVAAASPIAETISPLTTELVNTLTLERSNHSVNLSKEPRGVVITLDDSVCFDAGSADVRPAAVAIFDKIAKILSRYPNRVLLQGHTDSTPIHNGQFRSNWELSTARSIAVMQLMKSQADLLTERFLVAGAADNAPLSDNHTQEGRAQNRRVDIVILDDVANGQASALLADAHTVTSLPASSNKPN